MGVHDNGPACAMHTRPLVFMAKEHPTSTVNTITHVLVPLHDDHIGVRIGAACMDLARILPQFDASIHPEGLLRDCCAAASVFHQS